MSCAENDRDGETGEALSEVNYRQKSSDLVFLLQRIRFTLVLGS